MGKTDKNKIDLNTMYDNSRKSLNKTPNFDIPKFKLPEFKMPKFKAPRFNSPKFEKPKFNKVDFSLSKIVSIFIIIIFLGIIIAPNVSWKVMGKWGSEEYNRENRGFAPFPQIVKANYLNIAHGIDEWISDHTPFRKFFLETYAFLNRYLFESADSQRVMFGKDGFVFFKINEDSIVDTLGIHPYNEDQMAKILAKMLKVRDLYARNKDDYILFIAPNKEVVYNDKVFDPFRKKAETSTAKQLVKYIREHSDIKVVYPLGELQEGRKIMDTYYKTDDHWNAYGAYIGAGELIEALTGDKTDYSYFETIPDVDENLLTDLLDMIHMPKDYDKSENFAIKGYSKYDTKNTWLYRTNPNFVIGIDCSIVEEPVDDRSVTIIRDSFAIKMMYVLSQYFKTVNYIHYSSLDADTQTGSSIFHSDIFIHEFVERSLWRIEKDLDQLIENGERYFGEDENDDSYTKIIKGESDSKLLEEAIRKVKNKEFVQNSLVRKVSGEEVVEGPYAVDELPYDPILVEETIPESTYRTIDDRDVQESIKQDIEDRIKSQSGIGSATEEELVEKAETEEVLPDVALDKNIEKAIDEIAHRNKKVADIMRKIAIKTKLSLDNVEN